MSSNSDSADSSSLNDIDLVETPDELGGNSEGKLEPHIYFKL